MDILGGEKIRKDEETRWEEDRVREEKWDLEIQNIGDEKYTGSNIVFSQELTGI